MKKFILSAALLLSAAALANAQIGIVAGVTSSSTDIESAYNDVAKAQSVTQYHAGVVYKVGLAGGLYLQPGLIYDMKGAALKDQISGLSSNTYEVNIDTKTGYLEVPVQLGLQFDLLPSVSVYGFVEPYLGYAITTETTTKFQDSVSQSIAEAAASAAGYKLNTTNSDSDKWDGRERLEYGVGAGAGVLLFKHVGVSAKYFWDLGNVYNSDNTVNISSKTIYEQTKDKKCSGIMATVTLYF